MFGKSLTYLLLYVVVCIWVLAIVPKLFSLPQVGEPLTILLFLLPYLFACIFMSMTLFGIYDESRIAYVGVRFHVCHLVIYLGCLLAGGGYSSVLESGGLFVSFYSGYPGIYPYQYGWRFLA